MKYFRITATNQELEDIGVDIKINNIEGKSIGERDDGWHLIELLYRGAIYQYDIPERFLKEIK